MQLETLRFGNIEIDDAKIIEFSDGIPGFEGLKRFIIIADEEVEPICFLQSVDDRDIALPVVVPFLVTPEYDIEISQQEVEKLGIDDVSDVLVLAVVVIPDEIEKMTANLVAPIIINTRLGKGRQVVVDDKTLSPRFEIFAQLSSSAKEGAKNAGTD